LPPRQKSPVLDSMTLFDCTELTSYLSDFLWMVVFFRYFKGRTHEQRHKLSNGVIFIIRKGCKTWRNKWRRWKGDACLWCLHELKMIWSFFFYTFKMMNMLHERGSNIIIKLKEWMKRQWNSPYLKTCTRMRCLYEWNSWW